MISTTDLLTIPTLTKAQTIADWYNLSPILNTANWVLDADGVGVVASASSICLVNYGIGPDGKLTTSMEFTAGTVDLRIMARVLTNTSPNATYYWGGCTGTNFRIGKTVDGTFTTLATVAYTLAISTWATFTLSCLGTAITGTINDGSTSATLSASDNAITLGGVFAIRSGPTNTCNIKCRSLTAERAV